MNELDCRVPLVVTMVSLGLAACHGVDPGGEEEPGPADLAATPAAALAQERYILKLKDDSRRAEVLEATGATVALDLPRHGAVAVHLPVAAAQALKEHPLVEYVEIDAKRYPTAQVVPYGISMVQANNAAFSTPGGPVKVCIIDSGIETGHEDFQGLTISGEAGTAWSDDGCGHGTHVAGTIAAANNTVGVVGVAPDSVALHIVKVFGADCSWSYASTLIAAVDECQDAGAKVVSMSLGGPFWSFFENSAFASADAAGVLSVAAAGNGGNTAVSYPAGYASVVSVAAVDWNGTVASFSQQNSDVEIAAPGVSVLSTVPWTSSSYEHWSGTSMATPHVSGVLALLWSLHPSLTNTEIRAAMQVTAKDLGPAGRDDAYGFGLVQAKAALDHLNDGGGCSPSGSTESSCDDGADNDCDGAIDAADPDCAPACLPKGSSCNGNADCCSVKCRGPAGRRVCK